MAGFSLLTKILADFLFSFYLLNQVLKTRNKPYTTTLGTIMKKRIFIQVVKEFWIQFLISIIWAGYKIKWNFSTDNAIIDAITNFGASFFLLSWFIGQFLRIKKQQKIESHFEAITTDLKDLIQELEKSVSKIISNITGSESFAYVQIGNINKEKDYGQVVILQSGESPVYDANMEMLNYGISSDKDYGRFSLHLGVLKPNMAHTSSQIPLIKLDKNRIEHFNFSFSTRGGSFHTTLKMKFYKGKWFQAHRTVSMTLKKVLKVHIPENYPDIEKDAEIMRWRFYRELCG